jgi:hypothetical protein
MNYKLREELVISWDRDKPGYIFARNCAFDIYSVQAASVRQYASMMKYEKWLGKMNKSNGEDNQDTNIPERPVLTKTEDGNIEYSNIDRFLDYLVYRQHRVNSNLLKIKEYILSSLIKIVSLTLLWRALDMKVYFNSELIIELFKEPRRGEPAKPKLVIVYLKLYKLCFINLILDIVYWWAFLFILRVDKPLWDLCNRKLNEAKFRTLTTVDGQRTQEFKLTTLQSVYEYDDTKRELVREYSGYSLNERLENILFILGKIFAYRAEMIEKISNLKRIPQYKNIDNRTANLLIVKILGRDLMLYSLMSFSFSLNPTRIISFYYFVKSGTFKNTINPVIHFNRF